MAAEEHAPRTKPHANKTKKRKKPKKDKWGQTLSAAAAEEPSVEPEQEPSVELEQEPPAEETTEAAKAEETVAAAEGYELGKVVASGLPYTMTEAEIRKLFEWYGPLRSVQLSRFPDSGNFRGLAFVCFESDEVAIKSLELDGFKIGNRFMRVERCRVTASSNKKRKAEFQTDPEKSEGCLSAYVGNLSWNVTEKDLWDFFKSSKIASIRFAIDRRTGGSRGFCHVDFQDDESLEKAVAMNQSELQGRPVKVAYSVSNRV
ncbi:phragmoplastin interacting protein 1-like [Phragmites australis]|uniref:phragmoplastin interacting protein 1-like n=1 Tax=Phragmites australis TaxID=29695 RepID=UPI002D774F28|nr:phragmoplastin interacting protein 1-like [Phragmites australis]